MAKEQVVKLYRAAQSNPDLRDSLNTAPNAESFVAMANRQGFAFTLTEWQDMMRFSVEELDCQVSEIPGI